MSMCRAPSPIDLATRCRRSAGARCRRGGRRPSPSPGRRPRSAPDGAARSHRSRERRREKSSSNARRAGSANAMRFTTVSAGCGSAQPAAAARTTPRILATRCRRRCWHWSRGVHDPMTERPPAQITSRQAAPAVTARRLVQGRPARGWLRGQVRIPRGTGGTSVIGVGDGWGVQPAA